MSPVVSVFTAWHNGDVVDQDFKLIVIKIFDQLVVVVFEFLQAVIVIEKLVNCAVLTVK